MIPNIDNKTGIHYGVIPVNELFPEIFYEECHSVYHCNDCEYIDEWDSGHCAVCDSYSNLVGEKGDNLFMQLSEQGDVWVFNSPYTTLCSLCSPCAPNAGYLTDQSEVGVQTYCPPPEWLITPGEFKIIKGMTL